MRGRGAYQKAQIEHRDARVAELCRHLRLAIDLLEQIASDPYRRPENAPDPKPCPPVELPGEKATYTLREVSTAIGIGRSTLYNALNTGELQAIKLGRRTLIRREALRAWLDSLPLSRPLSR